MKLLENSKFLLSAAANLATIATIAMLLSASAAIAQPLGQTNIETDQNRARSAVEAGEIAPLLDVMSKVEEMYEGEIIEVQLEDGNEFAGDVGIGGTGLGGSDLEDRPPKNSDTNKTSNILYDIKLLTPQGNVLDIKMDAKTTEILTVRGRDAESARKQ